MSIITEELANLLSETIPAPWKYGQEQADPEWFIVTITGGLIVANVNAHSRQEANARLIALAPDLAKRVIAADKLVEALRFYANPAIYEPHPHGPAFDRRDVSFSARAALSEWEASK